METNVILVREEILDGQKSINILMHFNDKWQFPNEKAIRESGIIFESILDISRQYLTEVFILARYVKGGLLLEGFKWVPYQVLLDSELRNQYCPEGLNYNCIIGMEVLDDYFRKKYSVHMPKQTTVSKPTTKLIRTNLRKVRPEDMPDILKGRKPVYIKMGGSIYKGQIIQKRKGLVFSGRNYLKATETIKTMPGRVQLDDLWVEIK